MFRLKFGNNVRIYRLQKNMSQLDLAIEVGIDIRQIQRIEAGKVNTTVRTAYLLSKALNVTLDQLFDF